MALRSPESMLSAYAEKGCLLRLPAQLRPLLAAPPEASRLTALPGEALRLLRYRVVLAVGDYVSRWLLRLGVSPKAYVYDCATRRRGVPCPPPPEGYSVVEVSNPRGHLNPLLFRLLREAVSGSGRLAIRVHGEDDLAALAAIAAAPVGAAVVYGHPGVSALHLTVTPRLKLFVAEVVSDMDCVESSAAAGVGEF